MSDIIVKTHYSELDASVNFEVRNTDKDIGFMEARYVRRIPDYFIVYLSSQTGCQQACRMCHLTATGQTKLRDVTVEEYLKQAELVLDYYKTQAPAKLVHFNFMSRGEPFANKIFVDNADYILQQLANKAKELGLEYKFLISTIMPKAINNIELTDIFKNPDVYPVIYYSIYSLNLDFRRKWLGNALYPNHALAKLKEWQNVSKMPIKLHWAFIKDHNDKLSDVAGIVNAIKSHELDVKINIVRYNPHESQTYEESNLETINSLVAFMRNIIGNSNVKVVDRVGIDVKASCGTFLN